MKGGIKSRFCYIQNNYLHSTVLYHAQESFLKSLYGLLRCGKMESANEYSISNQYYSLAASLQGLTQPSYGITGISDGGNNEDEMNEDIRVGREESGNQNNNR